MDRGEVIGKCQALLNLVEEQMTAQGVHLAQEFIDHDEWGIGFETIVYELVTSGASLPYQARVIVGELGPILAKEEPYIGFVRTLTTLD